MTHTQAVLVRFSVLAVALTLYAWGVAATADPTGAGGANIGAGLLAFAGLVVTSGAWALLDGRRHGARLAVTWWTVVAALVALGSSVALAALQRDASMSFTQLLAADAGLIPFTFGVVLVPAAVGALLGQLVRRP